jgi:MFS family permease
VPAPRLARLAIAWAFVADTIPLYALYALLFADTGLSVAEISVLFAIWSLVGIVAEVPTGALADRFSRRGALVAAGVLQALGYALWIVAPGFPAFAAGFVLWGLGGTLVSGTFEALLYDGLADVGAEDQYARVMGRVTAVGLLAQLPAAGAATVLFSLGGYPLVGWVSVGCCLAASALATRLPEPARRGSSSGGYLATLRAGVAEAASQPAVRTALLAVAALTALDGFEEYIPLLGQDWGVPTGLVPLAVLAVPLVGAAGAALGGAARFGGRFLAVTLGAAALLLLAAGLVARPVGLVAVAAFYGAYRLVLVVAGARLQERIDSAARATVTSVAGLGTDLACLGLYAVWAAGGAALFSALVLLLAAVLPRWLSRTALHRAVPVVE